MEEQPPTKTPYRIPRMRVIARSRYKRKKPNQEKLEQLKRISDVFSHYRSKNLIYGLCKFYQYLGYSYEQSYDRAKEIMKRGEILNKHFPIITDLYEENLLLKEKIKFLQNKEKVPENPE
jgi:hypothetical protein